ncbi:MAG: DUF72 domain-containing protein [Coriobacteriales bacterium]|nr:DUF72 domain-containing protein [Coriobacteriales bacterium]
MGDVVVGTCSWTDKTMIKTWYPPGVTTAEGRLRYYADRFDAVEVDSSFYGLPKIEYAENWVKRTPPGFVFHMKAFGLMTGHEVDERALHPDLRDYPFVVTNRGRVREPDPRMVERAFELFLEAIGPLRDAGKMGGVLMQYPPWMTAKDSGLRHQNLERIAYDAEMLDGLPVFVEFRHASWVAPDNLGPTMKFLADRGLTFVSVDAPQIPGAPIMPRVTAATAPVGYVRFHGRNKGTWYARTQTAADRFDYEYTPEELEDWREPIRELADQTERTYVMFNNCKYDYAPTNAREMAEILGDLVVERRGHVATGEPAPREAEPGQGEGTGEVPGQDRLF